MILVIGGIKGGSGKSTLATNLSILRALDKKNILLVDADEQRSAIDWIEHRETIGTNIPITAIQISGASIYTQICRLKDNYDDIIIDTGGRDTTSQRSALSIADVFLTPFLPRSFDVWTIEKVCNLVTEMRTVNPKLKAYSILNRADSQGKDNVDAANILKEVESIEFLDMTIGQRKAFSNASAEGLSVIEHKPQDQKAIVEIRALYKALFRHYSDTRKASK